MPVRGERPVFPRSPKPPTGIFSTKGRQKVDSTSHFKYQGQLSYAYGSSSRSRPTAAGPSTKRHQPPK